jgi:GAF domain-containing protein
MAATVRERALNRAFADLAESLVSEFDVTALLQQLVGLVTDLFSVDSASVLLREASRDLQVLAASTEATQALELYQLRSRQGPGLECLRTGQPVTVPDLDEVSQRWALFAPTAREHGFAAMHAVPLRVRDEVIGAMDLYLTDHGELPARDLSAIQGLADVVSIGILQQRASDGRKMLEATQDVLHSQFVVEQAKGMLAASGGVSMDEAFDLLRHYTGYRENRVVEVAADLAAGRIQPSVIIEAGTLRRPPDAQG